MAELTKKQLIGKIRGLRQIKPRKDWVSLTKKEILGEEPGFTFFPYFKPALAGLIAIFLLFGFYGLVKNSLPGDFLYLIRKAAHQGQAVFIPESEKPAFQLKLANDRLEDLTKASAKNLAPTISEFQANISEAAKNLAKIDATTSNPVVIKKIVEETKKLEENKQKVESLGVVIGEEGTNELENAYKLLAEREIRNAENSTLTEKQENILKEAKEYFENGDYFNAFVKIIEVSQSK
jgi:phosphoglycolate phosphatase-like HAD superfamily hydrolase